MANHTTAVSESVIRVRYQETDQMGVVYHANYLVWFEVGRTEWIRKLGYTYKDLEEKGLLLPVVDLHVRYAAPARYDDEVTVRTRITEVAGGKLTFHYEILRRDDGQLLVTGTTTHLWVNREYKRVNLKHAFPALYERLAALVQEEA
jgi:acyl-CoA thioester hydrolase